MAGGSGGPPKLDRRNYAYWKARMAGYLEAINSIAWAVTEKPIVGAWNEDQIKYHARVKNALFDALSEEIFARVHSKKKLLTKFGKSLRPFMLGLQSFVRRSIKA